MKLISSRFLATVCLSALLASACSKAPPPSDSSLVSTNTSDYISNATSTPTLNSVACSRDISQTLSDLQSLPHNPLGANSMIMPLQEAKLLVSHLKNDSNCSKEYQQVSQLLSSYWSLWITFNYQKNLILEEGNNRVCRSGCIAFSSDAESCKRQCESSFQSVMSSLDSERQSHTQEFNAFKQNSFR
ncbi:hypothetical protein [Pseudanabaena sp. SR411]|uniref:hypothetical protein n=1 Tax=Pseudanabaena sp. SR411 TaxID=1980935 RepID=UPI00159636A3|nr:hypothetical protein [Pseudanabaena sp. SR411]